MNIGNMPTPPNHPSPKLSPCCCCVTCNENIVRVGRSPEFMSTEGVEAAVATRVPPLFPPMDLIPPFNPIARASAGL